MRREKYVDCIKINTSYTSITHAKFVYWCRCLERTFVSFTEKPPSFRRKSTITVMTRSDFVDKGRNTTRPGSRSGIQRLDGVPSAFTSITAVQAQSPVRPTGMLSDGERFTGDKQRRRRIRREDRTSIVAVAEDRRTIVVRHRIERTICSADAFIVHTRRTCEDNAVTYT